MAATACGGRLTSITVDADDAWGILLKCERCPLIAIQLDYLDRIGRRSIIIQTDGETIVADLVANTLSIGERRENCPVSIDESYNAMHRALFDGSPDVCSLEDGLSVCELVNAVELSARDLRWVGRAQ